MTSASIDWRDFLRAFSEAVNGVDASDYASPTRWTEAMLNVETGIIRMTAERLKRNFPLLRQKQQWYTVDALFVESSDTESFPERLLCIIEHENGPAWHEEIWKLAHWRCPLKVLIGYDYNDDRKSSPKRVDWLTTAIAAQRKFLSAVDELQGVEQGTDYLLIVGRKEASNETSPVIWEACRLNQPGEQPTSIAELISAI